MSESKSDVLREVESIVFGARNRDYGDPYDNHQRTAQMITAYLSRRFPGVTITAYDVCFFNILQKISRAANKMTRDTLVDIAGYAANLEIIENTIERQAVKQV